MDIKVLATELEGVRLVMPESFEDQRGFFFESYNLERYKAHGIDTVFVQDNHSRSTRGVLRGFHYQNMIAPQWRLVRCTRGEILDVVVDLRVGSPTFAKWLAFKLTDENRHQVLIPPEFAHGFYTVSDTAEVQYKCSGFYTPSAEAGLAWDDPDLAVTWPNREPILSERDKYVPRLDDYLTAPAFYYMSHEVGVR